jgi:hypothetical protein
VWLSGEHLPSVDARHENVNQESIEDSKLFESVRDSPEVAKALNVLLESGNAWVQEYAKLTLQVMGQ